MAVHERHRRPAPGELLEPPGISACGLPACWAIPLRPTISMAAGTTSYGPGGDDLPSYTVEVGMPKVPAFFRHAGVKLNSIALE
jgi:hypothetical protein